MNQAMAVMGNRRSDYKGLELYHYFIVMKKDKEVLYYLVVYSTS